MPMPAMGVLLRCNNLCCIAIWMLKPANQGTATRQIQSDRPPHPGCRTEGFNQFMNAIGREDRCFQLRSGDSYCFFLVAPETKFRKVAERLQIPLEPDPDRVRRHGIAYTRQVLELYSRS